MTGRTVRPDNSKEQEADTQLSSLLNKWKDISPQADFEAAVWERIQSAPASEPRHSGLVTTLREWFVPCSVWVNTMAAAAGVIIGIRLAFSTTVEDARHSMILPLPHSETMANAYFATITGERQ